MADEVNKEIQNSTDVKKGSKIKFFLIPIVLLVQAGIAYFIVFNVLNSKPVKAEKKIKKKEEKSVGQFFEIKDLVINPAGTRGRRFFVVEIGFETHNAQLIDEAESKRIWIRDSIIDLLTKKDIDQLLDISKRKQIKQEILNAVNKKLTKGKFEKIYFTKYILQ